MLLWITSCEGNRSSNGKVLPYKILDQAPLNTKLFRVNRETKLRSFNITERPETHTKEINTNILRCKRFLIQRKHCSTNISNKDVFSKHD